MTKLKATIDRKYFAAATIGKLTIKKKYLTFECATLELPYRNNEPDISCIPTGKYIVKPHVSPTFGKCLLVLDVPGRTHILFHVGNAAKDTNGCIVVGNRTGREDFIASSREAFKELLDFVGENELELIIRN